MQNSSKFKINSPDVVSETIDGETVIVSLSKGIYYSLDKVGADIWNLLEDDYSAGKIVSAILNKYSGEQRAIESSIKRLLAQLEAEDIIVTLEGTREEAESESFLESPAPQEEFVSPVLEKYSDMQELLMLDPIHEVDEAEGWPQKKGSDMEVVV